MQPDFYLVHLSFPLLFDSLCFPIVVIYILKRKGIYRKLTVSSGPLGPLKRKRSFLDSLFTHAILIKEHFIQVPKVPLFENSQNFCSWWDDMILFEKKTFGWIRHMAETVKYPLDVV